MDVVLGLSGGVDSAVAAALLQEQGHRVIGVYLDFGFGSPQDARAVAEQLGIEMRVLPLQRQLEETVCAYFRASYEKGETPNPCILCNPQVKFRALQQLADQLGGADIATGHYARVDRDGPTPRLLRARSDKDQSYMLYRLPLPLLRRCRFPLGEFEGKEQVRRAARERGLSVSQKKDSMEVCFIPDGDYAGYLERYGVCPPPGEFVDEEGRVLGRHRGIHRYTPGQRRGLGVSAAGRLFVQRVCPDTNRVVLSLQQPRQRQVRLRQCVFLAPEYETAQAFSARVRVRHSRDDAPATVCPGPEGEARLIFEPPVRAAAPGQSAVFYQGERVVGGGVICP